MTARKVRGAATYREDEVYWLDQVLKAMARSRDLGVFTRNPAYASIRAKVARMKNAYENAKREEG